MNEDQMAGEIIEAVKSAEAHDEQFDSATIQAEKHYNYYGDRGVVDLYVRKDFSGHQRDNIWELKGNAAINEATGANEILRQFNRMCEYFYRDETNSYPDRWKRQDTPVTFYLTFAPTPACVEHVDEYISIYSSVEQSLSLHGRRDATLVVEFFTDGNNHVGILNNDEISYKSEGFWRRVRYFDRLETAFEESSVSMEVEDE